MALKSLSTTSSMAVAGLLGGQGLTVGVGALGLIATTVDKSRLADVASAIASYNSKEIDTTVLDKIAAEFASKTFVTDKINIYSIADSIPFYKVVAELSELDSVSQMILPLLPAGISGLINQDILDKQAASGIAFSSTNLIDNIVQQTREYAKNNVSGLVNIILTAKNFVEQSLQNYASLELATRLPSQSPSFNSETLFDQITVGILNGVYRYGEVTEDQLGDPNSVSNTIYKQSIMNDLQQQLYSLGADMIRFGTMYDITKLSTTFTITGFMENLINQGVNLRPAFARLNLSYTKDNVSNPTILKQVLAGVRGNELEQIKNSLGFSLPISTLDQALDPVIVLNPRTLALVKNFNGLVEKIENIGPNFASSFNQLGTVLQKIQLPRASDLLGFESDLNRYKGAVSAESLKRKLGTGTGPFRNPTMDDVITSMTGASYNYLMMLLINSQNKILATASGQNLYNSLSQAITYAKSNTGDTGTADEYKHLNTIRGSIERFLSDSDVDLRENLAVCQNIFIKLLDKITNEKINILAARLDLNNQDPGSEVLNINSFVFNLEDAGTDENELGFKTIVENLASNDIYGEAIRATIVEGTNKKLLRNIGVNFVLPDVKAIVATRQFDKEISDSLCCGPQVEIEILEPGQALDAKGRLVVVPRSGIWYLGNHLTAFPKIAEYKVLKYTVDYAIVASGPVVSESFGDTTVTTPSGTVVPYVPTIDFTVSFQCPPQDSGDPVGIIITNVTGTKPGSIFGARCAYYKSELFLESGPYGMRTKWDTPLPYIDKSSPTISFYVYPFKPGQAQTAQFWVMVADEIDLNSGNIPRNNKIKSINVIC